jgi:geranylgeranyl diphosphate synthase type II
VTTDATFDLAAYLKDRAREVDRAMETFLPADAPYMGNLGEAMRYGVFPGGKRFRPVLTLAAAEALGADRSLAMPAACAFELVHCFSLVHDDMPCMDNDVERRGKPTCHVAFGEDVALLAGDGLVIHAFEVAAATAELAGPEATVRVVRELARASGHPGMVGGQVLDMDAQHRGVDGKGLLAIHHAKTGALIRGSVRAGAIVGGASEDQLQALTGYGERVGLVFQITDDILDAGEDPDPISFPALFGMEASRRMATEATEEAVNLLRPFGPAAEPLVHLARYLLDRSV